MRKVRDLPEVRVFDSDVEGGIKVLRRLVANSGVYAVLKNRRRNPSISARKRAKLRRSVERLKRAKLKGGRW